MATKKLTTSQKNRFAKLAEKYQKLQAEFDQLMTETKNLNYASNSIFGINRTNAATSIVKSLAEEAQEM